MKSIEKIQQLRKITSLGILECKKALIKSDGNIEAAIKHLYNKGSIKYMKKDAKKLGFVSIATNKKMNASIIIEFNTQTDFVSKNENFLEFVNGVTKLGLYNKTKNLDELLQSEIDNVKVKDKISILINQFKENISVGRIKYIEAEKGVIGSYVHNNKIAAVVILDKDLKELAHDLAIHVAAMRPEYIKPDDIETSRLEKERKILNDQVKQNNKNKNAFIISKITEGKLNKLFQEITLYKQTFVKDKGKTIEDLMNDNKCNVIYICRFEVEKS